MYKLYYLVSPSTDSYYIGITKQPLVRRFSAHRCSAKAGIKSPVYDAMRKYGDFEIQLVEEFNSEVDCANAEIEHIEHAKQRGDSIYNLHRGGHIDFDVTTKSSDQVEAWKGKLSKARQGRTPALGMKHTEETKKLCGEYGKLRWDIHGRYPQEVLELGFAEAHRIYGISKTHYYRMRRACNECS